MKTTIYRAANTNNATTGACFSTRENDAAAYLTNPGFGGAMLHSFELELRYVLDLQVSNPWSVLATELLDGMIEADEETEMPVLSQRAIEACENAGIVSPSDQARLLARLTELQGDLDEGQSPLKALDNGTGRLYYVWEENEGFRALLARSYEWLQYDEDYPEQSTTLCYLGSETLEGKVID